MLTITTTQEGRETNRTIRDEQGNVIARARYQRWSSDMGAKFILTQQLQQAGYTWEDVDQE